MSSISEGYRRISPLEVEFVASELAAAWTDPAIPVRQWERVVKGELENLRAGRSLPVFDVLIRALRRIPPLSHRPHLLDVGASSAFYSEIIPLLGFDCRYEALDYSNDYRKLAARLYPDVLFHVADAKKLPFADSSFDIVLSSGVLIHTLDYQDVIAEAARVSSGFVVLARTPITLNGKTEFFEKTGYDTRMLEIHWSEEEMLSAFAAAGLNFVSEENIFVDPDSKVRHVTYLLEVA